jgi:pimeloyl-ACP methyl ester carboxylesterase
MRVTLPSGVEVEYQLNGPVDAPPVLLVMGLGAQLIHWPEGLVHRIAAGNRRVIRFDNRDAGLSTKFSDATVDMGALMGALMANDPASVADKVPYLLSHMSDDGFALLDHLGIQQAHVVGASMGGMIAQTMAIAHPERVLSLTSIMSNTGEVEYGSATPDAMGALLVPSPTDRVGYIDHAVQVAPAWMGTPDLDLDAVRAGAAHSWDRGLSPEGVSRQFGAIIASGSRADALRTLSVPTLIVHGADDPLVNVTGGQRGAALVPDAELLVLDRMGHDLPRHHWDTLAAAILKHTDR